VLMAMDSGIVALRPSSLVIGNALRSRSFRLHARAKRNESAKCITVSLSYDKKKWGLLLPIYLYSIPNSYSFPLLSCLISYVLRKLDRLREEEELIAQDPSVGAVPEIVADRMLGRIIAFFGVPVFGGLAIFVGAFFYSKKYDVVVPPNLM
jgi:hypothetical protein